MSQTDLATSAARWYARNARDLPWRAGGVGAWAILVSEVMLQQTPVARVLPVWTDWLARWPEPADLASEPPAEAIRAWGRLGYPRRALRLHECAQAIVSRHRGRVPHILDDLLALPGVGAYTARAVAAFAFGQRQPVVDTNVRRLVARAVNGVAEAGPATTAADLAAIETLLPGRPAAAARASVALMELGALVCTARAPRCADCPLAAGCAWRRRGRPPAAATTRRTQRYVGTDRHVRGLLLAALRGSAGPVTREQLDMVWTDADQRQRALDGLLADRLVEPAAGGRVALRGDGGRPPRPER
jgi:A/G-specific adenine glycosylase